MNNNTFDALANEHRRRLLVALSDENPQPDNVQSSATVGVGVMQTEQPVRVELYHVHLPKLEDYGFIQWNKDTGEISKGSQFSEIRPLLECIVDHTEKNWADA